MNCCGTACLADTGGMFKVERYARVRRVVVLVEGGSELPTNTWFRAAGNSPTSEMSKISN